MKNYLYIIIVALAVGCTAKGSVEEKPNLPELPVLQVTTKDTILHHDYVTSIEAVKNVEIRARVQGFLNKIFVDEGAEVKKGQPLFQLDDHEWAIQVAKAKASVSNAVAEAKTAEVELTRVKILLSKKIISPTELDMVEAKLKAAKAKIEEAVSVQKDAETKLSYTFIRAPFDGIIDRIPQKVGSLIDEGSLLTTLSDNHDVYAYFTVSESDYLHYKKESAESRDNIVHLVLADGSAYKHPGKIETVDGEFDETTGSIAFRAKFPNPNKLLRHGATGKVRLTAPAKDALIVPQKSVFEIQDKNYVFIVDSGNIVKMKSIVPETRVANYYIIKDGLSNGDKIVYEGVQNIKEGVRIQPRTVTREL
ncbi:MAG: efflux RND transporter periplasmic adaptor subunit [Chitinophagaceae bacterium]|nr:efflux RND transporter periplasmic adaptor subunit [Chitinophagaceae bacterium]